MNQNHANDALWSTACGSEPPDTTPMELAALGQHVQHCRGQGERLTRLHCAAQSLHRFVSARLISTACALALLALLLGF